MEIVDTSHESSDFGLAFISKKNVGLKSVVSKLKQYEYLECVPGPEKQNSYITKSLSSVHYYS